MPRQLVAADDAPPKAPAETRHGRLGIVLEPNTAAIDDRDARAELTDVVDDVRRQDDDAVLSELGEQIQKAHALFGVEPGRRLVDDDQAGITEQCDRDPEPLAHAARKAA